MKTFKRSLKIALILVLFLLIFGIGGLYYNIPFLVGIIIGLTLLLIIAIAAAIVISLTLLFIWLFE